mmetsp:Transcript_53147/g.123724  ORF Transcript_53147/g.123724 Transcript_53147/m.123724 type:complete len:285 (-) Transcript_53147:179-1033(-)
MASEILSKRSCNVSTSLLHCSRCASARALREVLASVKAAVASPRSFSPKRPDSTRNDCCACSTSTATLAATASCTWVSRLPPPPLESCSASNASRSSMSAKRASSEFSRTVTGSCSASSVSGAPCSPSFSTRSLEQSANNSACFCSASCCSAQVPCRWWPCARSSAITSSKRGTAPIPRLNSMNAERMTSSVSPMSTCRLSKCRFHSSAIRSSSGSLMRAGSGNTAASSMTESLTQAGSGNTVASSMALTHVIWPQPPSGSNRSREGCFAQKARTLPTTPLMPG